MITGRLVFVLMGYLSRKSQFNAPLRHLADEELDSLKCHVGFLECATLIACQWICDVAYIQKMCVRIVVIVACGL